MDALYQLSYAPVRESNQIVAPKPNRSDFQAGMIGRTHSIAKYPGPHRTKMPRPHAP